MYGRQKKHILNRIRKIGITTVYCILFHSCTFQIEPTPSLSAKQQHTINYFKEVAFGFEYGNASKVTRKWFDDIVIFVGGNPNQKLEVELENAIYEINKLIGVANICIKITTDSLESNYYFYFGSGTEYQSIISSAKDLVQSNFGLNLVFTNRKNEIVSGSSYVDIYRADSIKQHHLLLEELIQSLGLGNDSPTYSESIFQSSYQLGCATKLAEIDKSLILLLYDQRLKVGLNEKSVDFILKEIIVDYV